MSHELFLILYTPALRLLFLKKIEEKKSKNELKSVRTFKTRPSWPTSIFILESRALLVLSDSGLATRIQTHCNFYGPHGTCLKYFCNHVSWSKIAFAQRFEKYFFHLVFYSKLLSWNLNGIYILCTTLLWTSTRLFKIPPTRSPLLLHCYCYKPNS